MSETQDECSAASPLLSRFIEAGFEECTGADGVFILFGKWYRPALGCDSLQAAFEEVETWASETRDLMTDPATDFVAFMDRQFKHIG